MPPKKQTKDGKVPDKAKQKVVEDKTFGLKNKKGKKQQTYIKNVATQVQGEAKKAAAAPKLSKKELEKQKLEELNALFKPVQKIQVVAAGVDPKSVLCLYIKQGTCQKGNRCKFSHDLSIERKSEKRSLYADGRGEEGDKEKDGMGSWDQATLEDVVNKKHGTSNASKTEIVCKFFLDAVEKNLYGWFWNCPNGENCMYRHALPPGFILKKDQKKEDEVDKISLEEHIEKERNELSGALTPVTMQTFLAWKKRKIQEKQDKHSQEMNKKEKEFRQGKGLLKISGKEVFMFKPELADADDDEADDGIFNYGDDGEEEEEDEVKCVEIDLETFKINAENAANDSRITKVHTLHAKDRETATAPTSGGGQVDEEEPEADNSNSNDVEIDESLFEDLDDLDLEDGD